LVVGLVEQEGRFRRFTTHLRVEVDLDTLAAELRIVVGDTMAPAPVSL
jgi:hypothetical protein